MIGFSELLAARDQRRALHALTEEAAECTCCYGEGKFGVLLTDPRAQEECERCDGSGYEPESEAA